MLHVIFITFQHEKHHRIAQQKYNEKFHYIFLYVSSFLSTSPIGVIMMIAAILVLLLGGVLIHVWFRIKDMGVWKKVGYSLASFFVFLIAFIFADINSDVKMDLQNEQGKNEQLTENVSALESSHEDLESQLEALHISVTDLEDELTAVTKEKDTLQKKYGSLEKENKELTDENAAFKKDAEKAKETASVKNEVHTASSKTSESSNASNADGESSSTSKSSSESGKTLNDSTSTSDDSNSTDAASCDIKGSVNGIYHVPGSRYYNQTKNVVQWFCSTAEAEAAGYRAPK